MGSRLEPLADHSDQFTEDKTDQSIPKTQRRLEKVCYHTDCTLDRGFPKMDGPYVQ